MNLALKREIEVIPPSSVIGRQKVLSAGFIESMDRLFVSHQRHWRANLFWVEQGLVLRVAISGLEPESPCFDHPRRIEPQQ
jgi:hypothetical protein